MQRKYLTEKTTIQPWYFTVLRIVLGFVLAWKGIVFVRDTTLLQHLIEQTGVGVFSQNADTLAFIITYLTLLCGVFIACGLFTRISSIVQIPILITAIIFVNVRMAEQPGSAELILSIITLILLIVFAIKGSSQFSADEFFRTYYRAGTDSGQTKRFIKGD